MGTWATDSFGNDAALDWAAELKDHKGDALAFLSVTLESGENEAVIAAAELLAHLTDPVPENLDEELLDWCEGVEPPDSELREKAASAVQGILDDEDEDVHDTWAELGEEDEDYLAWKASLQSILDRLK